MTIEVTEQKLPLEHYQGKKVKMTYTKDGSTGPVEIVGTLEVANELAVMVRPHGKPNSIMIFNPAESVLDYCLDDSKPPKLQQKELKDVTLSTVRAHLADRHAVSLSEINEMDEESAAELHASWPHAIHSHTHPAIKTAEAGADGKEPSDEELFDEDEDEDDEDYEDPSIQSGD